MSDRNASGQLRMAISAARADSALGRHFKLERPCRLCRIERRGATGIEFTASIALCLVWLNMGATDGSRIVMMECSPRCNTRDVDCCRAFDQGLWTNATGATVTRLTQRANREADITMTPNPPSDAGYGQPVTVSADVRFHQVSWPVTPMLINGTDMTATTSTRRKTVQRLVRSTEGVFPAWLGTTSGSFACDQNP